MSLNHSPPDASDKERPILHTMGVPDLSYSLGGGKDNLHGLHLVNRREGDKSVMELVVAREQCGFPGISHCRIAFTMLF
jgi:hypothetical protein